MPPPSPSSARTMLNAALMRRRRSPRSILCSRHSSLPAVSTPPSPAGQASLVALTATFSRARNSRFVIVLRSRSRADPFLVLHPKTQDRKAEARLIFLFPYSLCIAGTKSQNDSIHVDRLYTMMISCWLHYAVCPIYVLRLHEFYANEFANSKRIANHVQIIDDQSRSIQFVVTLHGHGKSHLFVVNDAS